MIRYVLLGGFALFSLALTWSMVRGGRFADRWYTGGKSRLDRDGEGRPTEPTDNVRDYRR